jgi:elongation factor Ts
MMDCKKALAEAKGNLEEAEVILRKKHGLTASKKAGRETKEGTVASYIHLGGKVGVLVEINCETDFVARNEDFRAFVKDITLQIAANNPLCIRREEVDPNLIAKEKEIAAAQITGKPPAVVEKIVEGKIEKYYATICLLEQPFIKDQNKTIQELLLAIIAQTGENIVIRRFARFAVGD